MEVGNVRDMKVVERRQSVKMKMRNKSEDQTLLESEEPLPKQCRFEANSPDNSVLLSHLTTSSSHSNQISYVIKHQSRSSHSKVENCGNDACISTNNGGFRGRKRSSTEFQLGIMEASNKIRKKKQQHSSPVAISGGAKMPSTAEIEDFFSVAEKYEQKRFTNKYNYDIVKDVPLEGRYQWVRINP